MGTIAMIHRIDRQLMALHIAQMLIQIEITKLDVEGNELDALQADSLEMIELTLAELREDLARFRREYGVT